MESDRITVSLPFSPDPLKTPSRTSPLPPLPPYPPPELAAKDASGKSSGNMALFRPLGAVFGVKDERTRRASLRYVGRGIRLFPGAVDASNSIWKLIKLSLMLWLSETPCGEFESFYYTPSAKINSTIREIIFVVACELS